MRLPSRARCPVAAGNRRRDQCEPTARVKPPEGAAAAVFAVAGRCRRRCRRRDVPGSHRMGCRRRGRSAVRVRSVPTTRRRRPGLSKPWWPTHRIGEPCLCRDNPRRVQHRSPTWSRWRFTRSARSPVSNWRGRSTSPNVSMSAGCHPMALFSGRCRRPRAQLPPGARPASRRCRAVPRHGRCPVARRSASSVRARRCPRRGPGRTGRGIWSRPTNTGGCTPKLGARRVARTQRAHPSAEDHLRS